MPTPRSARPAARTPLVCLAALLASATLAVRAEDPGPADVVVVVDTSTSMREAGMDPERTSLLVAKLLADVVPGELAVVRLLDLKADADVLPSRQTGKTEPCQEDPSRECHMVEPASDWGADARRKKLGTSVRPRRGDADYKRRLESHLDQGINNSLFDLAFRAAQGVFDAHKAETDVPRTVIWLSDGRTDDEEGLRQVVGELRQDGVVVKAIVFGRGETRLAGELGLEPRQVGSPAELMAAFADAFRSVVGAPYRIDNRLDVAPSFEMKPNVDEAWVVVYGDDTLEGATVEGTGGELEADYAADRWPGAGAYRVAYLRKPPAGSYSVAARGGGAEVAYAVVQRSDLRPTLLDPKKATAGVATELVAGVRIGLDGELVRDPELLAGATLEAVFEGESHPLSAVGDGRFSARVTFHKWGTARVELRVKSPLVERRAIARVEVEDNRTFWERWGKWILAGLALLVLAAIVWGYVWPQRFQRALAVAFGPDLADLDEQSPQPVAQWKGVGIGFYRHARAFLHADFRLSGQARGALAALHAEKKATRVRALGTPLYRQTLDGDWEAVEPEGRRVRPGDVYRVGEQGPFFRIALQGGRR